MTDELRQETAEKLPNPVKNNKPFVKGYDPRRNLRGVPKDAIEARKFFRKIGAELLTIKEKDENGQTVEYDITRLEARARLAFSSKNYKEFEMLIKVLYPGLLKDEVDISNSDGSLQPKETDDTRFNRAISSLADALRESVPDQGTGTQSAVDAGKPSAVAGVPEQG